MHAVVSARFTIRKLLTLPLLLGLLVMFGVHFAASVKAAPGINQQMNFQGRLLTSEGAVVSDGFYNIQFKIYQDGDGQTAGNPSGTLLWTEDHLNDDGNGVQVKNGFLSVQLGSVTPFGSSVDWDQDTLWLSMNIGDTGGTCTPFANCNPDGEMVPMKRLSSSPYALNAGRVGGLASSDFVQLAQGVQTDAANGDSIQLNKTGTGDFVNLQSNSTDVLTFTGTGDIQLGANADHTISVADSAADTDGNNLTVAAGDAGTGTAVNGGDLVLQGGAASGSGTSGSVIVQSNGSDSTTALQVLDVDGGNPVFNVDTENERVGIGTDAPSSAFHLVQGGQGSVYGLEIEGPGASIMLYEDFGNEMHLDFGDEYFVGNPDNTYATDGTVQSGRALNLRSWDNSELGSVNILIGNDTVASFDTDGAATFKNTSDSTAAFTVLDSDDDSVFSVDTTGGSAVLGDSDQQGALVIHDGSGQTVTFALATQTSSLTLTVPDAGGNDTICLENLANCGAAGITLQDAYDNSTTPEIVVDATRGGFTIQDNGTPIGGNLFEVQSNGGGTTYFSVDANGIVTSGDVAINGGDITSTNSIAISTDGTTRATFDTSNNLYLGNGVTAAAPNDFTVSGTNSSTTGVAGGTITIQGGNATVGNANGGNITITGGAGVGTGARGLVVIDTPTFTTATAQSCGTNCTITQANVDNSGGVVVDATAEGLTVTLPDPTNNTTPGRIVYVTAAMGSSDFTLEVNGGGTGNEIAMRSNTSATMIWSGSDWTAAGASSSTTLQAAYNNTLTSAGGAELILSEPGGNADGLTIRNNPTDQITGGILEVQSSIGTNLFSVNDVGTELAANGGSESDGSWTTDWTTVGSSSISRTTTSGEYVTGQAGAEVTTTAAADDGIRNNLSDDPVVNTTYQVSFTAKLDTGTFDTLEVVYSRDGGTDIEQCSNYNSQTLSTSEWTKITCTIPTDSTSPSDPDLIIRQTDATARTFWIDNLSFVRNDSTTEPSHVQIGGGITGGQVTLFTLDRSSAPPVEAGNETYLGSMYYDTSSGRVQCYESGGWGACGGAPDTIVTLTPEYSGAVLNGEGIGTMTADFCANDTDLQVNTGFCTSGLSRQYYRWTSPQASEQEYSIYVSYKLPNTFKEFVDDNTVTLTALTDSIANGEVGYEVFRSTGGAVTDCGSGETVVTTPDPDTWYKKTYDGNETQCGFTGGDYIVFKINVRAQNNANVYVENLDFTYLNQ